MRLRTANTRAKRKEAHRVYTDAFWFHVNRPGRTEAQRRRIANSAYIRRQRRKRR